MSQTVKLNNGIEMPIVGLGVYQMTEQEAYDSVSYAIEAGYRHIDTAQFYQNERAVGRAVNDSGKREKIFVTTKIQIANFGYEQVKKSVDESLNLMNFDYLDAVILHWPVEKYRIESYKALEELYKENKLKSIGVSNFTIKHLEELLTNTEIVPTVNQVEFTPFLFQKELLEFCNKNKIQVVAYSPLTQGKMLDDATLTEFANKYGKTPAQMLIRWCIDHNVVVIPKSKTEERIKQNLDVFDFKISNEDLKVLDSLNQNKRFSWNPEDPKQVKVFSSTIVRKLSKLIKRKQ